MSFKVFLNTFRHLIWLGFLIWVPTLVSHKSFSKVRHFFLYFSLQKYEKIPIPQNFHIIFSNP